MLSKLFISNCLVAALKMQYFQGTSTFWENKSHMVRDMGNMENAEAQECVYSLKPASRIVHCEMWVVLMPDPRIILPCLWYFPLTLSLSSITTPL